MTDSLGDAQPVRSADDLTAEELALVHQALVDNGYDTAAEPVGDPAGEAPVGPVDQSAHHGRRNPWLSWLVAGLILALVVASGVGYLIVTIRNQPALADVPPGAKVSIPAVPEPTDSTAGEQDQTMPDRPVGQVPAVVPEGFIDPPTGTGQQRYLDQGLNWQDCGVEQVPSGVCATVAAPLDYNDPDGQAITLSLAKVPATTEPKLGTIFVNPGGPGGAGRELALTFDRGGLEMYDIVGWDPRGTGASTPVVCENGSALDDLYALDTTPDDQAEETALFDGWEQFGQTCLASSGSLLEHVSTDETVKDLEMLRQLVGDSKLNYLGYSYGTSIGAHYAQNHTETVGKMVLDSPVNITQDYSVTQASGFDDALDAFAEWCVSQSCSLGDSPDAVKKTITNMFDSLDSRPINVGGNRRLTESTAVTGVLSFFYYDQQGYPLLLEAIEQTLEGNGRALLGVADQYAGRDAETGQYDPMLMANIAINCLDYPDAGEAQAVEDWEETAQTDSIFGKYLGINAACPVWPIKARYDDTKITADGAAPILVVGSVGDTATPYPYAVWMAEQMTSAILVTYGGAGHATYGGTSACIDSTVVDYFTDSGEIPDGLYCQT